MYEAAQYSPDSFAVMAFDMVQLANPVIYDLRRHKKHFPVSSVLTIVETARFETITHPPFSLLHVSYSAISPIPNNNGYVDKHPNVCRRLGSSSIICQAFWCCVCFAMGVESRKWNPAPQAKLPCVTDLVEYGISFEVDMNA